MWQHDLGEQPFSREERRFLSRAGRSLVSLDTLMARVEAVAGTEQPSRGRQSYLAGRLMDERLFSSFEEAYAFADSYYALAKAGPISKHLLWDWE
jgi:hypothetical protein